MKFIRSMIIKKIMALAETIKFVTSHPLNSKRKITSLWKFLKWQIGSRLVDGNVAVKFVGETRLLISRGMAGATGNLYTGLHEFEDMSFILHALRAEDYFIDIGSNIGSYTVLASGVAQAKCIAFEPVPQTYRFLLDNIHLNGLFNNVIAKNMGVGNCHELLKFTSGLDCINHVLSKSEEHLPYISVPVEPLDDSLNGLVPFLIKIDVEGFETNVIRGAGKTLTSPDLCGVLMELNGSGDRYGFSEVELHNQMIKYGFQTYKYLPLTRELVSLEGKTSGAGNTLYLKNIDHIKDRIKAAPRFATNNGWLI